jgi:hypothetical protein
MDPTVSLLLLSTLLNQRVVECYADNTNYLKKLSLKLRTEMVILVITCGVSRYYGLINPAAPDPEW